MKTINLLESTMPKKTKTRRHYSSKDKENLLAKYDELRKTGQTAKQAAKQFQVPYQTFLRWNQGGSPAKKKAAVKTKVATSRGAKKRGPGRPPKASASRRGKRRGRGRPPASAAKTRGGLTLMTPAGFRIEGISSQELIRLLKALR